jgi:hypothetical protein
MNYSDPLFLIPALTDKVFILAGFDIPVFPPKKINIFYGT